MRDIKNYIVVEVSNLDIGTTEIRILENKPSGIYMIYGKRFEPATFEFEEFTDLIAFCYEKVPASIGHSITTETILT